MLRRPPVLSLVALAVLGTSACVDDGTSLRIECPAVADEECFYDAMGEECLLRGALNLNPNAAQTYNLALRVSSGLFPRESDIPVVAEPNNMHVRSARVEILRADGTLADFGALPNPFTVDSSGRVPVEGFGIAAVRVLPPDYVRLLREQDYASTDGNVVAVIQLTARTDGNREVRSAEWLWPIDLLEPSTAATNCLPVDDADGYCTPYQDGDLLPLCES